MIWTLRDWMSLFSLKTLTQLSVHQICIRFDTHIFHIIKKLICRRVQNTAAPEHATHSTLLPLSTPHTAHCCPWARHTHSTLLPLSTPHTAHCCPWARHTQHTAAPEHATHSTQLPLSTPHTASTAPLIYHSRIWFQSVVSFTLRPIYPWRKTLVTTQYEAVRVGG
jgi:hypothetical protein